MTDEEKKAIEYLKGYKYDNEVRQAIDIVLNLIEKQQKQIEELNKENNRQHELICNIHNKNVSKEKIKEIHKNTDNRYDFAKEILKLIGE